MNVLKLFGLALLFSFSQTLFADPIKTIHFGTDASYPPFEYVDDKGNFAGFDIDIANAICASMNAQCTFSSGTFDDLITDLNAGKYDAIIAAIGITETREKMVSFTEPYYTQTASFVAPIAKHYTMGDIEGKNIGIQKGSLFFSYLTDKYHNKVKIVPFNDFPDAFKALKDKKIDLVIGDEATVKSWLKENGNSHEFGIVVGPIINADYLGNGFGIAVRKNEPDLLNALNKAIADINANGKYKTIRDTYFK